MSASLANSSELSLTAWFNNLVRAALTEYSLLNPDDVLSKTLIRDPEFMLPMFVSVVADNPTISTTGWSDASPEEKEADIRYALSSNWAAMSAAIPE
jgi:hypothetical protein